MKCWHGYLSGSVCHPIISCFIKVHIGFSFLVPFYPGYLEKRPLNGRQLDPRSKIYTDKTMDEHVLMQSFLCATLYLFVAVLDTLWIFFIFMHHFLATFQLSQGYPDDPWFSSSTCTESEPLGNWLYRPDTVTLPTVSHGTQGNSAFAKSSYCEHKPFLLLSSCCEQTGSVWLVLNSLHQWCCWVLLVNRFLVQVQLRISVRYYYCYLNVLVKVTLSRICWGTLYVVWEKYPWSISSTLS